MIWWMEEGMTEKERMTNKEGKMMDDWKGRNEWRTDEYLPRAVMNIEMNDECRNECEKMLKERMITDLVWNEY